MPAAIAVPIGLAIAGMVSQNVNNKAALKNNENQQATAVGNSQSAWQHAQQQLQQWMQSNPAPFGQFNIARPTPYGAPPPGAPPTGAGGPGAPGGARALPGALGAPGGHPLAGHPETVNPILQQLIAHLRNGGPVMQPPMGPRM